MAKGRRHSLVQQSLYVSLGEAIRRARGSRSQTDLAESIGGDQTTLSDYEKARVRVPLDVVVALEDALDLPRGRLLVDAGYVPIGDDVLDVIRRDPSIDDARREFIIDAYEQGRERVRAAQALEQARKKAQRSTVDEDPHVTLDPAIAQPNPDDPDETELWALEHMPERTKLRLIVGLRRERAEEAAPRAG